MRPTPLSITCALLLALLLTAMFVPAALAVSDEEQETLELFFDEQDRVVTVTRTPKPISQVAENVTVVTAEEIERMNAHTLAEVLNVVPGVQVFLMGNPTNIADTVIQGSEVNHVRIMIDGVPINNLLYNNAEIGPISTQSIERIEIIKGPSSALWGSAMGGVINVVTKSPPENRTFGGTLSASLGTRETGDTRAEFSGSVGNYGYYLLGSNFRTDGFHPSDKADVNNILHTSRMGLGDKGQIDVALRYFEGRRGFGQSETFGLKFNNSFEHFIPSAKFDYSITDNVSVNVLTYLRSLDTKTDYNSIDADELLLNFDHRENAYGASVTLNWTEGSNALTVGYDYEAGDYNFDINGPLEGGYSDVVRSRKLRKGGFFVADTLDIDRFSISASARYDYFNLFGSHVSFNTGLAYRVTDQTILRFLVAKGYSLPVLQTVKDSLEKVWTYQAGVETSDLKYFWLKSTVFQHEGDDERIGLAVGKLRRRGFEIEAKTIPFFNTSLQLGYLFVDTKDLDTGETVKSTPPYTFDAGIVYDDRKSLSATLLGHYVRFNAYDVYEGKDTAMIWDFSVTKKLTLGPPGKTMDLFFSAHNLFDGAQNLFGYARNPGRWFEGGIRFKF